ncbi:MAG TPA: Ig-like domain-containing protein [Candidatus Sulfotelmatobacter sp.]|nr:Ig-like domain-containing protein [Candidatus Sulfotelmatobacter sp.]
MFLPKSKLRIVGAFAALTALALAVSCTGFFQSPTLTGVSVGPQGLSLTLNQTWQMSATGTYNDGSQKTLTSGVTWSSSDPTTVSIGQTSGQVKGLQTGQATVTAAAGSCSACSGSTTVTVILTGVSSITVKPPTASTIRNGNVIYYTALANGATDITNAGAVWTVVDSTNTDQTANFALGYAPGQGEGIVPTTNATVGTYTVQATYSGIVGKATLSVTQ